jgi:serine/threonine-protein kinase
MTPPGAQADTLTVPSSGLNLPPVPFSVPIPPQLDEKYRVERLLGDGAMGKVMLALDERLDRQVAIKFIRPEFVNSAEARERFVQEARAMARVHDPHVVEIYALGEANGIPYLVMQFIPGCTLEARLAENPGEPLPLAAALDVLDQICRGVEAIHASGTVHRDLKPSNILLGPGGQVAVADLGLAVRVTSRDGEEVCELAGTPAYLSPEVIARRPVPVSLAPRADVYALGVLAFRLLTGRLPFEAGNPAELLAMHLDTAPPSLRDRRPELPPSLESVVLHALHKDPAARLPSVEALRLSLHRAWPPAHEETPSLFPGALVVDDRDAPPASLSAPLPR